MNIKRRNKILESLKNKEYRDAFVSEHIDTGLPFQIKALREKREWSQEKLGKEAGMHQERISALEDPNYGKFTLRTLKKLASAFDVALMVVFVPFSKLLDWESDLSPDALRVVSFKEDDFSLEPIGKKEEGDIPEETIKDKINPRMFRAHPDLVPGNYLLIPKPSNPLVGALSFVQEPSESDLIAKMKEKENETSLNKPSSFNLAGTIN